MLISSTFKLIAMNGLAARCHLVLLATTRQSSQLFPTAFAPGPAAKACTLLTVMLACRSVGRTIGNGGLVKTERPQVTLSLAEMDNGSWVIKKPRVSLTRPRERHKAASTHCAGLARRLISETEIRSGSNWS